MASGHVNRINRPNTWLLRPDAQRAKSSYQHGAVHTWHKRDIRSGIRRVSFQEQSRRSGEGLPTSASDRFCCRSARYEGCGALAAAKRGPLGRTL